MPKRKLRSDFKFTVIKDLTKDLKPITKKRSLNCRVKSVKYTDTTNTKIIKTVKCNEPYSEEGKGHIVYIKLRPSQVKDKNLRTLPVLRIPVKVFCTCPAFLYWGSKYNATKNNYLIAGEKKEYRPPVIRDPENKNLVCKHIVAVQNKLKSKSVKYALRGNQSKHSEEEEYASDELVARILEDTLGITFEEGLDIVDVLDKAVEDEE